MTSKFTIKLPFLEYEHEGVPASARIGVRPLYDEVEAIREKFELAIADDHALETAEQLLFLASLVPPSRRREAIQLVRKLRNRGRANTQTSPGDAQALDDLFNAAHLCFESLSANILTVTDSKTGVDARSNADAIAEAVGEGLEQGKTTCTHPSPNAVVDLDGLALGFEGSSVFEGVSLTLMPGEVVGVIGRNGAGKSSLLRAMAGLIAPHAGAVRYPALQQQYDRDSAIVNSVLYVGQSTTAWPGTVENCLRMYASLRGITKADTADQVSYAMELLGLTEFRAHTYRQLSDGFRTRFELAKASITYPKVLLLDEPFGPLDAASRRSYSTTLRTLVESPAWKMAVVIAAQDTLDMQQAVDRVLVLDRRGLHPVGDFSTQQGVTFEMSVDLSAEEIASIIAGISAVTLDIDVLPYRIHAPTRDEAMSVLQSMFQSGVPVHYLREITGTIEPIGEEQ